MIVNVNSNESMFSETQHTLGFSAIAQCIMVKEIPKPTKKLPISYDSFRSVPSRSTECEDKDMIISDLEEKVVINLAAQSVSVD